MCGHCGCQHELNQHKDSKIVEIEQEILQENQHLAKINRDFFHQRNILALNLVSSPGSGKTTLLVETIKQLKNEYSISVIEGDQQTDLDAEAIRALHVPVVQVNTGKTCHLNAQDVYRSISKLVLEDNSILFIENVGNLVCPALFDLGETCKVVILSTTEGVDKPLKYPYIFNQSELMIINKIDLLPHVTFDADRCIHYAKQVNATIQIIQLSAVTLHGLNNWIRWINHRVTCKDYV